MQITHAEARRLIQFDADRALNSSSQAALVAHLQDCSDCRRYAQEVNEVEGLLRPVMQKQWGQKPIPLSISALLRRKQRARLQTSPLLTMRSVVIALVFAAAAFSLRQFIVASVPDTQFTPSSILAAPTPSAQSTSTRLVSENCEALVYTVQNSDTLASLAVQFTVSKEEIMALNEMKNETLHTGTQLKIPTCHFTPTGTFIATMFTRTGTPLTSPTTSTPGPGG